MNLFWDTSALVALIFEEPQSAEAAMARDATTTGYAWRWIRVEAAAALSRRRSTEEGWKRLADLLAGLIFMDLPTAEFDAVCLANRRWRLRASDAAHLHCFRRAAYAMPDLHLVSLDEEMLAVARASALHVWQAPGSGDVRTSPGVRETGAACGARGRPRTGGGLAGGARVVYVSSP